MSNREFWQNPVVTAIVATVGSTIILGTAGYIMGLPQSLTKIRAEAQDATRQAKRAKEHAVKNEGVIEDMQDRRQSFRERVLQDLAEIKANQEQLQSDLRGGQ